MTGKDTACQHLPEVLYANISNTVFVIDIPYSISSSQQIYPKHSNVPLPRLPSIIKSSKPIESPFPSTEPKSVAGRERIKQHSSAQEADLHDRYASIAEQALQETRDARSADGQLMEYCRTRVIAGTEGSTAMQSSRKRKEPPAQKHDSASDAEDFRNCIVQRYCNVSDEPESFVLGLDTTHNTSQLLSTELEPTYTLPPRSAFLLRPVQDVESFHNLIQNIPRTSDPPISFLLLDPPWPNRSASRRASYVTHDPRDIDELKTLLLHTRIDKYLADSAYIAIWITNKAACRDVVLGSGGLFEQWGIQVVEEWIWLKVTRWGEPVTTLRGIWRRPYEVCIIGRKTPRQHHNSQTKARRNPQTMTAGGVLQRRVLIGVSDLHSRKPCLKGLVEKLLLQGQKSFPIWGIEIFARYSVAEWLAWGDQAILFNKDDWWIQEPSREGD